MKRVLTLILILAAVSCTSKPIKRRPAADSELSFTKFSELINNSTATTVQQVLAGVATADRSHFDKYLLAFNSYSLQTSTWLLPRAVVFTPSGKFIFTFNGDPQSDGYNTIETMQFDDELKKFIFREFVMKGDGGKIHLEPDEIETQNERFVVSKANPQRCLNCHGTVTHPHPIWDRYHTWPGFYGALEEYDLPLEGGLPDNARANSRFINLKRDIELENFRKFMANRMQNPLSRYQYIPDKSKREFGYGSTNNEFSHVISTLYFQAQAREVAAIKKVKPFRHAILAGMVCKDPYLPAIGKTIGKTYREDSPQFKKLYANTAYLQYQYFLVKINRLKQDFGADNLIFNVYAPTPIGELMAFQNLDPMYFIPRLKTEEDKRSLEAFLKMEIKPRVASLRNVMEGQGFSLSTWGLAPTPDSYIFESNGYPLEAYHIFLKAFGGPRFDAEVWGLSERLSGNENTNLVQDELCRLLRTKSLKITYALK